MRFLLNLSDCVKSYGYFCQIFALFTRPAKQGKCHFLPGGGPLEIFQVL